MIDFHNAALVWSWDDAPEEYRKLSPHGGDEDLVIFLPTHDNSLPVWTERIHFGDPSVHQLAEGVVLIYAHS